ncbi:MAG: DUF4209 domain-containing protein [Chthoniobacterales bacterium]
MEETKGPNALPITGKAIPDVDIELPIQGVENRCCQEYDDAYFKAAKETKDENIKALFQSLGIICSFYPQYGNVAEPYRAAMIEHDRRTAIPSDLTGADIQTVEHFLSVAKDPALRARFADVLWLQKKSAHLAARAAVTDYLSSACDSLKPKGWLYAVEAYQRALQLAAKFGRKNEPYAEAQAAVLQAVENPVVKGERFLACHLLSLIRDFRIGDPIKMADVANSHAQKAASANDPRRERSYLLLQSDFYHLADEPSKATATKIAAAETHIVEAEEHTKRTPPSYFAASDSLAKGVEALRQAGGDPERIKELRRRLQQFQKSSMGEMKSFSIPMDLTEAKEAAKRYVTHDELRRSLIFLALGVDVVDVATLRKEVIEAVNHAPFTHLIGGAVVDVEGRTLAHKKSLLSLTGEEAEEELRNQMFEHAANLDWRLRAQTFIEPARIQIWCQHEPRMNDLEYLVLHNSFIAPGHEAFFLYGLYYGLAGDFMIAGHLLAPQLENSIRYVLQQHGVDITNLYSDLTQPVKTLGALFDMPETQRIFGANLLFEMRGIWVEKRGYSFRNDIAHALVTQAGCYSEAAINLWWLVLKLCHASMTLPDDLEKTPGEQSTG